MNSYPRGSITGRVQRVIDGDTFVLENGARVRLMTIDAPELDMPYGRESAQALKDLIEGKNVRVLYYRTDKWGRYISQVYLADDWSRKQEIGYTLVEQGSAFVGHWLTPDWFEYANKYWEAEREARNNRRGLWRENQNPERPEEYRRRMNVEEGEKEQRQNSGRLPQQYEEDQYEETRSKELSQNMEILEGELYQDQPRLAEMVQDENKPAWRTIVEDPQTPEQNRKEPNLDELYKKLNRNSSFTITIENGTHKGKTYRFALLPAIETALRSSGQNVPDVNPGIKIVTEMNYQKHLIPGGPPVYQSLGIRGRYLLLVGTLIGNEGFVENPKASALDIRWDGKSVHPDTKLNSYQSSLTLDRGLIQLGEPVHLRLFSESDHTDENLLLTVYGVIENIRFFCTRADRTYYAFTISCLWWETTQPTNTKKEN